MGQQRDQGRKQKIYADKKVKEWKMVFHANGKEKKAGVAYLYLTMWILKPKL